MGPFPYLVYPNLLYLELNDIGITEFPDCICKLTKLHILIVRNNKIEVIPKSINNLTELRVLDLSNNSINSMPALGIEKLITLNLTYNNIHYLNIYAYSCLSECYIGFNNFYDFRGAYNYVEDAVIRGSDIPMRICMCDLKDFDNFTDRIAMSNTVNVEFIHLSNRLHTIRRKSYYAKHEYEYIIYPRENDDYVCGCKLTTYEKDRIFYYSNLPDPTLSKNKYKYKNVHKQ